VHGLRETQCTGLAHKIIATSPSISPPSPLHTLHTRTASKKVAVAAHQLHLDKLPIIPSFFRIPAGLAYWAILIGLSVVHGKSRPRRPRRYRMATVAIDWRRENTCLCLSSSTKFSPDNEWYGFHMKYSSLLLVCVSFTIIGQPRNSVLIRRV